MLNELNVLFDNVLRDLGCEVNELHIVAQVVKRFDSVVVFEIPVHRGLDMMTFPSHCSGIFLLEYDLSDDSGFMRNT